MRLLPNDKRAAGFGVGPRTFPVSIYLASEANATEVELALVELLDWAEIDIIRTKPPIIDSWFGLMIGRFRRWMSSEQANEIVARVERALEVRLLDQPQANVDATEAEAVARLMAALENQPSACIQVGSIFLLKVDGIMVVRNLSPDELSFLGRNHTVLATPHQVLAALEAFSAPGQEVGTRARHPVCWCLLRIAPGAGDAGGVSAPVSVGQNSIYWAVQAPVLVGARPFCGVYGVAATLRPGRVPHRSPTPEWQGL